LYVGFILTFGTMHVSGVLGMPRRIFSYEPDRGWTFLNQLTTVGSAIQGLSFFVLLYNLLASLRNGAPAGSDPWDAWTLEWSTTSPPPAYNFALVPTVHSRRPLWDLKHPDDPDWKYEGKDQTKPLASPASSILHPSSIAQWGMISFFMSEVALFGTLIVTYVFYLGKDVVGPTPAEALSLPLVVFTTLCLLGSSATIHLAERALGRGNRGAFLRWWLATIALGAVFLAGTAFEWHELIERHHLTISRNLFGTTYYTLVGLHAIHVTVGVTLLALVLGLSLGRRAERGEVGLVSWYWHFVDVVWVVVFTVVYVIGR
jgi:heme/copper-type cytochrome/quinol oxidase subunit 3